MLTEHDCVREKLSLDRSVHGQHSAHWQEWLVTDRFLKGLGESRVETDHRCQRLCAGDNRKL